MTANHLLALTREAGIVLEAQGERLMVDAPRGVLTPELRAELANHKPELLAVLVPVTAVVTLKNGPTLPLPALRLVWDLERRGFTLRLVPQPGTDAVVVEPTAGLTAEDRAALARWRRHVAALISYVDEVIA